MNGWGRLAIALAASLLGHWLLSRALEALPRREAKAPELDLEPIQLRVIERVEQTPIAIAPIEIATPPPGFEPAPEPSAPAPAPPAPAPPPAPPPAPKSPTAKPRRASKADADRRILEALRSTAHDALFQDEVSALRLDEPAARLLGDEFGLGSVSAGGDRVGGTVLRWTGGDGGGDFGAAGPPPGRPGGGGVLSAGEVSKLPTVRGECRGQYTEAAREAAIEGTVMLRLVVGPDGATRDIKVVRGLGHGLDAAAVAALERCRFDPGMRDGEAVAVRIPFKVQFRLDE